MEVVVADDPMPVIEGCQVMRELLHQIRWQRARRKLALQPGHQIGQPIYRDGVDRHLQLGAAPGQRDCLVGVRLRR